MPTDERTKTQIDSTRYAFAEPEALSLASNLPDTVCRSSQSRKRLLNVEAPKEVASLRSSVLYFGVRAALIIRLRNPPWCLHLYVKFSTGATIRFDHQLVGVIRHNTVDHWSIRANG